MTTDRKPTLAIDFDGVIHSYERGWCDGVIYGSVVPGFFAWAARAQEHFVLAVYSSRSGEDERYRAMVDWLVDQAVTWSAEAGAPKIELAFPVGKPPAWLTIDDRCIRFDGDWSDPRLEAAALLAFKPWMQRR